MDSPVGLYLLAMSEEKSCYGGVCVWYAIGTFFHLDPLENAQERMSTRGAMSDGKL